MLLAQTIERIITLGGNVSIDATKYIPQVLERFAVIAGQSGATLTIRNCGGLLPSTIERITSFGGGNVTFILD